MALLAQGPRPYGTTTPPIMTLDLEAECDISVSVEWTSIQSPGTQAFLQGDSGVLSLTLTNNLSNGKTLNMPQLIPGLELVFPWEDAFPVLDFNVPHVVNCGYTVTGTAGSTITLEFGGCPASLDFTIQAPAHNELFYDSFSDANDINLSVHTANTGQNWFVSDAAQNPADDQFPSIQDNQLSTNIRMPWAFPMVQVPADTPYYIEFQGTFNHVNTSYMTWLRSATLSGSDPDNAMWMGSMQLASGGDPNGPVDVLSNMLNAQFSQSLGNEFTIRLEFDGATMVVKANGTVILTDPDTLYQSLPGGYMGFELFDSNRDISINTYIVDVL